MDVCACCSIIGLVVGVTTKYSTSDSSDVSVTTVPPSAQPDVSDDSQAGTAQASATPNFARLIHPMLVNLPVMATAVPGDSSLERYQASYDIVLGSRYVHLVYDVQVRKDRIHLDQEQDVLDVSCGDGEVNVTMSEGSVANFTARVNTGSTIITVLKEWGCTGSAIFVADGNGNCDAIADYGLEQPIVATHMVTQTLLNYYTRACHACFRNSFYGACIFDVVETHLTASFVKAQYGSAKNMYSGSCCNVVTVSVRLSRCDSSESCTLR